MNTLSSLLNWLGNTIGANPNTLSTTSKTLVGAINENASAISENASAISTANTEIDGLKTKTTVTTGYSAISNLSVRNFSLFKIGGVVYFTCQFDVKTAVSSGLTNVITGIPSGYRPSENAHIAGFHAGGTAYPFNITAGGAVQCGQPLPVANYYSISATWVV